MSTAGRPRKNAIQSVESRRHNVASMFATRVPLSIMFHTEAVKYTKEI